MKLRNIVKYFAVATLYLGLIFMVLSSLGWSFRPFNFGIYIFIIGVSMILYIDYNIKILTKSKQRKIEEELLRFIGNVINGFESITQDLENECGKDILNKKISNHMGSDFKLSLRDRYGSICTDLLHLTFSFAKKSGIDIDDARFDKKIDEIFGNNRIYDGVYNSYGYIPHFRKSGFLMANEVNRRWWDASKDKKFTK